jgi:hypothetical protein
MTIKSGNGHKCKSSPQFGDSTSSA